MKLLGHILKADNNDPLRQVSFKNNKATEKRDEKRKRGSPKTIWQFGAKEIAWKNIGIWQQTWKRIIPIRGKMHR